MYKSATKIIAFFLPVICFAQIELGIKAGGNLHASREVDGNGLFGLDSDNRIESESDLGFHVGILAEFEFQSLGILFRPELVYTDYSYDYDIGPDGGNRLDIQKLDLPLLVGINIKGPIRLLVGPSIQYVVDTDFDIDFFEEAKVDEFGINGQVGLGVKLKKIDVDLRYEFGLSNSNVAYETRVIGDIINRLDFDVTPSQLILSVAYRFGI